MQNDNTNRFIETLEGLDTPFELIITSNDPDQNPVEPF